MQMRGRISAKGVLSVLLVMGAGAVWAVEDGVSTAEAVKQSMTLQEIIQTGGWLMYVLGAMSVIALAFVVYFLIVLRRERITPSGFVRDLRDMIAADRLAEASTACRKNGSASAVVVSAALDYVDRVGDADTVLLKEIMEGEGSRQAGLIQNQTQYLLDIAVIAPMIGLLGTVMGMLQAFNAVALDIAKAKPMVLAAGVSQALITTAAGLIVGIPAMIFYSYFRGRAAKLISNLEAMSAEILALLAHRGNGKDF